MKLLMRLLGLAGVLILLGLILAVYLIVTFDPNDYKARLEAAFAEATGRELTLAGPIELTLFPSLGIRLEDVRMANADGFGETPFAALRVVDMSVAVLPLLRGDLDVQRVEADGGALHLSRLEDGRSNYDDLIERLNPAGEAQARGDPLGTTHNTAVRSLQAAGPGTSRLALDDVRIAAVAVTDLRVEWDDRRNGVRMTLNPANLRVTDLRVGVDSPLQFDAELRLQPDAGEPTSADLKLAAQLNADIEANRYLLRGTEVDLGLQPAALEPRLEFRVESDLLLDLAASQFRADPWSTAFSDLRLQGFIELGGLDTEQPQLRAEVSSNTFDLQAVLTSLGLDVPATTDPEALRQMALEFSAAGDSQRVVLDPLQLRLDDSSLEGEAAVLLSGPRPVVSFDLAGDRLDLDRYLPREVEEGHAADRPGLPATTSPANGSTEPQEASAPGDKAAREDTPIELPVELMRAFDLDGRLTLEQLTLLGLVLQDIELVLRARDGEWQLEPLTGNAYQGRLESRAAVSVRQAVPSFDLALALDRVAIGRLLEALRVRESRLEGSGSLALALAASGLSVGAVTSSLNGTGDLRLLDGAVRGINVARIIRHADARLRGEAPEDDGEPDQTDFSELRGSFEIRDGVVRNDDLSASSPLLRVLGRGSADLINETVDYRLDTTLVATIEGQGGRSLDQLKGLNLPIRVTGAFAEPRYRLDLEDVAREKLEDRVRREADRLQERLLERLGGSRESGSESQPAQDPDAAGSAPQGSGSRSLEDRLDRLLDRARDLR